LYSGKKRMAIGTYVYSKVFAGRTGGKRITTTTGYSNLIVFGMYIFFQAFSLLSISISCTNYSVD
jgi:hypothetical protein